MNGEAKIRVCCSDGWNGMDVVLGTLTYGDESEHRGIIRDVVEIEIDIEDGWRNTIMSGSGPVPCARVVGFAFDGSWCA